MFDAMGAEKCLMKPALHPASIGRFPIRPLEALRAFVRIARDKEDTLQVFVFIRALTGRSLVSGYQRFIATPEGGRQAYLALELAKQLEDCDWLARFKCGTVGACYREFIALRDLSAYGLADESRRLGEPDIDAAHPIAWHSRRLRDIHDIWHVLTGFGTDALGEACLLAFTFAQTGNPAIGLLAAGAAFELKRRIWPAPFLRAVLQGWRNGRRAQWLPPIDYVELFSEPLETARVRLQIARPRAYEAVPPDARNAFEHPAEATLVGYWPTEA